MPAEVTPRIVVDIDLYGKQDDEQHADPELEVEVVGIVIEGDSAKGVDGYADDQQQAEHKGGEMEGKL